MIIGVVGKANVGKSTFFKSATLAEVEIANYPFATIKPNSGVGYVKIKDVAKEFNKTANPREGYILGEWRFVPVQMIDVAGLVPGAHEGKGMGNQFLDDLRQAHVLIHVIDCSGSTNEKGEPINPGTYDPANDVKFLEEELDYWYLGIIDKGWDKFARTVQQSHGEVHKAIAKQLSGLMVTEEMVEITLKKLGLSSNLLDWDDKQRMQLATELRKLTKPMIIACNKMDVPVAYENFEKLKKEFPDRLFVACSAESELALKEAAKHNIVNYIPGDNNFEIILGDKITDKQNKALDFIKNNILKNYNGTGVQTVLDKSVFDLLKYKAIHPGGVSKLEDSNGNVLPDCFLLPHEATALDFAFRLHTDFGNNFVKAINVRTKMPMGKEHILDHLDIIEIMAKK
ncbi:MAG: redox-regulated ATPase YchF [Candidatus Woesearchaeota archaeon]